MVSAPQSGAEKVSLQPADIAAPRDELLPRQVDGQIIADFRTWLAARDDLSPAAKQVQISSLNGDVTLRGPVADAWEKILIGAQTLLQNGVRRVDNHLDPVPH